jgi:hypothetical protein
MSKKPDAIILRPSGLARRRLIDADTAGLDYPKFAMDSPRLYLFQSFAQRSSHQTEHRPQTTHYHDARCGFRREPERIRKAQV